MKQNYATKVPFTISFNSLRKRSSAILMLMTFGVLKLSSQSYTFTPAGATGSLGPTQLQVSNAYLSTNLNGSVVSTGGIQSFTIPTGGNYRVSARGAQGAGANGGFAALMEGDFTFATNDVIRIVVGQAGVIGAGEPFACGGGGGSYVLKGSGNLVANILVIAGGGGGSPGTYSISRNANTGTSGNWGAGAANTDGAPGVNGNGGNRSKSSGTDRGAGGGGFFTDGQSIAQTVGRAVGGSAFVNGSNGGSHNDTGAPGGFGGGGAVWTTGFRGGGGGGGYSGGGGGQTDAVANTHCGGGGGSFNAGTNQANSISTATGDGIVVITSLCNLTMVNASTAGPGPICNGGSATLTSNGISNYSWSNGAVTSSIVVSPTVTTQYTLTAMSPLNCTTSAVITVTVIDGTPTVSAVTSNSAICAGATVTLTASGAATYTWSNGVTNAVTYTPTSTNIYTVTGSNACGSASTTVGVTVNTSPAVIATVSSPTVCNGGSVTFTSSGNATNYTWSHGIVSGTPYFPTGTGTYTLLGTANGCSSVSVIGVTVLVTPTIPPAVTPTAICVGATATLSSSGASSYVWTPGSNPNSSTLAVSPPISTTYTLVRSNGLCSSTMTVNLVVNPLPLVNASANPPQICAGQGVNISVIGPITNTWLPGGFTAASVTLFPNSPTCYTVTGSNGNCTATAAVCVTVNPTPPLTITTPTNTICEGQSIVLTAGGALTYTWLPSGLSNTLETVSPLATSLFTLTGTNSYSCTNSITQLILVNAAGNISVSPSSSYICNGGNALFTIANPSPNVVYSWSSGQIGTSIPVTPTVTTNYTVTGTNTITGCAASNSIAMAVYISTFSVNSPTAICIGETAAMSASGAATSFSWSANGGTVAPSVTVAPVLNTTYYVTGTNASCSNTLAVPIVVNPLPNVTATTAKPQICKFEIATVSGAGATTYSWDTGANTQVLTFTLTVTTTYTVTGTDTKGCSKKATVTQFVATCLGIGENEDSGSGVNIYPNPNNGTFVVRSDEKITLNIVNTLGQLITIIDLTDGNNREVTVDKLPAGIYFIRSTAGSQKINTKIVVER